MKIRWLNTTLIVALAALVAGCGGGGAGGGGGGNGGNPGDTAPQTQTITFATTGPISGVVGSAITNTASGGAGVGAVSYASSNTSVATVNSATGIVNLLAMGSVTITATKAASTGFNQATASYSITVTPSPQVIAFTQAGPLTVQVGAAITNTASGGAGTGAITYASSNTGVVAVSQTGMAIAGGAGTAVITATKASDANYLQAQTTYSITVTPGVQAISFTQAGPFNVSQGAVINNSVNGGAGTGATTYASSNTSAVIVNQISGAATAVGAGTAVITATKAADGNFLQAQAAYLITVEKTLQSIAFSQAGTLNLTIGSVVNNSASGGAGTGAITYASSNTGVVTVNQSTGAATAVGVGTAVITATKAADPNYQQAQAAYSITSIVGTTQSIAFFQAGPLNVLLGSVTSNTASGGVGSGAITYTSSNINAVSVNQTTGAATATGVGTAVITATKAGDAIYSPAQTTYTINSQTPSKISAFIGSTATEVSLPASANGKNFARARVTDCLPTDTVVTCANSQSSSVNGAIIGDNKATLTTPAYYAIVNGATVGTPIEVRADRFSNRIGHAAVYFNNRYWVIGGGEPIVSVSAPVKYTAKADVWSSADGRTWKLEAADGGFGARWWHSAVVFNNRIWIFSGSAIPAQSPLPWYADSWSSADGKTWTRESTDLQLPWWSTALNVFVANGEILAISGGRIYSYSQGPHTFVRKTASIVDISGTPERSWASLSYYNNQWWYIGGAQAFNIHTNPQTGNALNDVWKSSDGITWTQVLPDGHAFFSRRYRHSSFVANGKLWVMGGQAVNNGVDGAVSADAWSTTDGVTWSQENISGIARGYLVQTVQEPNRVTLLGGVQVGVANNVWQSNDGLNWSELSSHAQFSPRVAPQGVEFNGEMWIVGGFAVDGRIADRDSNEVWHSSDGLNWSRTATSGARFSPRDAHSLVVFNNRLWVIGGQNNSLDVGGASARLNDVWSSADGITWTQDVANAPFSPRTVPSATVFGGKLWVIGGCTSATTCVNDVWSSNDGATWVPVPSSAPFSERAAGVVVLNNALWVFGGETATGTSIHDVWRSPDGVNWTEQTPGTRYAPRTRGGLKVFNGRVYVVGGVSITDYAIGIRYNDVWSSADGLTWRQDIDHAAFSPRSLHSLIPHNNELWLVGGYDWDIVNDVWRSSDGVNWRIGFSHDIEAP